MKSHGSVTVAAGMIALAAAAFLVFGPDTVKCRDCYGGGKDTSAIRVAVCSACGGNGSALIKTDRLRAQTCLKCSGSGLSGVPVPPCGPCGGDGRVSLWRKYGP